MEIEKTVEIRKPEMEAGREKKPYQAPKLVEHGQWTEKTRPPIGGSGG